MPRTGTSAVACKVAGRAIRDARREVGVTQAELAGRLSVSASYVCELEAGRSNVTVGQLWAIANALRVELRIELSAPAERSLPTVRPQLSAPAKKSGSEPPDVHKRR